MDPAVLPLNLPNLTMAYLQLQPQLPQQHQLQQQLNQLQLLHLQLLQLQHQLLLPLLQHQLLLLL